MSKPVFSKPSKGLFSSGKNYMVIPDTHLPYQHPKALDFLQSVRDLFQIEDDRIYHTGDLLDMYTFSSHPKGPDAPHTANQEIEHARKDIKKWAKAFPTMKICLGNHELRLFRKLAHGELPSQIVRSIQEIFEFPETWELKQNFIVPAKHKFVIIHGEGFSGANGHVAAANTHRMSTVVGHLHSFGGVNYMNTVTGQIWACNAGCLIDVDAYCFDYAKNMRAKPTLGVLVVLDDGARPFWIPLV